MERFWQKVERGNHCWTWRACRNKLGYGSFRLNGRPHIAHRVAWELERDPIPDGLCVLHKCDNPSCVNPDHLFLGTRADNSNDKVAKNRQNHPAGETNPRAKLTQEQVAEIRLLYVNTSKGIVDLAADYGMGKSQIWNIVSGEHWKDAV